MKHQHQEMQTKDKPGHPFMLLITLRSCFIKALQVYIWREVINLLAAQTKAKTIPYHFQLYQVFIEKSLSFESP